ncbi:MAG: hypothetical protein AAB467_01925 [Patescibacteria group bacterium]
MNEDGRKDGQPLEVALGDDLRAVGAMAEQREQANPSLVLTGMFSGYKISLNTITGGPIELVIRLTKGADVYVLAITKDGTAKLDAHGQSCEIEEPFGGAH